MAIIKMELLNQLRNELLKISTLVTCNGYMPLPLNDPNTVCWVDAGIINVFGIPQSDHEVLNKRTPIFQAQANDILFGIAASSQPLNLIAVGNADTQLRIMPLAAFSKLITDPSYQLLISKMIEKWIFGLSAKLVNAQTVNPNWLVEQPQTIELQELQTLSSLHGCFWFKILDGALTYTQDSQILQASATDYYPILQPLWLTAQTKQVHLALQNTASYIQQPSFFNSLANFHRFVLDEIAKQLSEQVDYESQRFANKRQGDITAVNNAFKKMLAILKPSKKPLVTEATSHSPLITACQLIGNALQITIEPPHSSTANLRLTDILTNAGVQLREVQLDKGWWHRDGGPLLVFRESDGAPCAAIPIQANRYQLIDPASGNQIELDAKIAQELAPIGYTFYRPFSQNIITGRDLIKFSIKDNLNDIFRVFIAGILGGLLGMLTPIFTGALFDKVIPNAEKTQLLQIVIALITAGFALGLFQLVRVFAIIRISGKTNLRLEAALWDRLLRLPMSFFKHYNTGDLTTRALAISSIRQIFTGITVSAILSVLFSVFSFILLFYYSWQLALLATGLVLIVATVTLLLSIWQIHHQRTLQNLTGKVTGLILQLINGIAKLQSAGRENKAFSLWAEQFSEQKRFSYKTRLLSNSLQTFNAFFVPVMSLAIYALIAFKLKDLAIGDYIAFSAAFGQFIGSVMGMTSAITQSLMVIPLFERAKPILDSLPETSLEKIDPGILRGEIEFNRVNFRYSEDGPLILKDISFTVKPGQFIAFVGKSGAGKSTLLRLLLGFEQANSGSIFCDGKDIYQLNMQRLRRQLGVVLQNSALISDSIFRNIVGSAPLTMDEAWEAARLAGFDQDIESMPMGMHTVLSEGARTISGGQRQRLMIARALAQKPRVLIFDEATSALDNRTQALVSQSLEKLNITRIVIAHRLSTITNANLIFVVDNGEIVQRGSYQELAEQQGIFADLIKRQMI
ncbi:MAG: bacteriocin system transporter, ATP-binding protein [Gammaproteobacteria bacterium]|jgi:NHLM bacteriocin system ABC transporter ATP-binding protein|nr:bacteriocin system transporter, ATP-binding protein [Gammaproteobacteria bacterium]